MSAIVYNDLKHTKSGILWRGAESTPVQITPREKVSGPLWSNSRA